MTVVSWWIPRATIRRLLRAFMEHLDVDVPDDAIDKAIDDFIEGRTAVRFESTAPGMDMAREEHAQQLADVVVMLPERETSIEQLADHTTVTVEVDGAQVEVEGTIESRGDER